MSGLGPAARLVRVAAADSRYLALSTALLQEMRLALPDGGIWEAADVQWWSGRQRPTDRDEQPFWLDAHGDPLAAVLRTGFGAGVQCDVLIRPEASDLARAVWETAVEEASTAGPSAEFPVREDDEIGRSALAAAGYLPSGEPGVVCCWLDAAARPAVPALPAGYRLLSLADAPADPHPMAARNGAAIAARLRRCSLYRPDLDLRVLAPGGEVAAYSLYWADPVTGVGLVEPVRTEAAHSRRGVASHMLATGLDRLAAAGCARLKVASDLGLYLRAGFRPLSTAAIYSRPPA